jgi:uridine phosphorylase
MKASELILTPEGQIYHLRLKPEELADNIILAGDPGRVAEISKYFDEVELRVENREFVTHTGSYKGTRITAMSTGIGTDNIDIVLNELDALVNIDFSTRSLKTGHKRLDIIRLGTSGGLQAELDPGTAVASKYAIGFDGLLNFYAGRDEVSDKGCENAFMEHTRWNPLLTTPYVCEGARGLLEKVAPENPKGYTISAPGFYGPQGRELRLKVADPQIFENIRSFTYNDHRITNFEMECSAIYGLSKLLGHNALTVCVIIANRETGQFLEDYHPAVDKMIRDTLDNLVG